ncbi:MAG TPA: PH domain-containing protein [Opitutaceae bacterium]|nr:PH domain-containing protein [Opitutaceae bacterium]
MSYLSKRLMAGETVVKEARIHGIVYLPAVAVAILGGAACLYLSQLSDPDAQNAAKALAIVLGLYALYLALRGWIRRAAARFYVTNRRVLIRLGLIRQRSVEMLLTQIEGVTVRQGMLGRLLGYGTVVVEGTGGDHDPFRFIGHPEDFRLAIQEQIEAHARSLAAPSREIPGKPLDRYAELSRLDELRQRGVLTEDEFQSEKRRLLGTG